MLDYWKEEIMKRPEKRVSFYEYMAACLYHPEFGYYMSDKVKIGKEGDYYTSSSVHSVFAETILELVIDVFNQQAKPIRFYEMGAGTGLFARQFLDALEQKYPQAYKQAAYVLIEKSGYHRHLQKEQLLKHEQVVSWLDDLTQPVPATGIFFSNELVDAFPVHLIEKDEDQLYEIGVTWNGEKLVETMYPVQNQAILAYLEQYGFNLVEGQRMEIPLDALNWVAEVNDFLDEGLWLTIDYGYTNEQLMHPAHRRGSLLCYYQHQRDDNPYLKPGQKDITYHIHFDVLRDRAVELGWTDLGFYNQADFLLRAGIIKMLDDHQESDPFARGIPQKNRAIRQLISPESISGSFHVLALAKGDFAELGQNYSFTQPFSFQTFAP